VFLHVAVHFGDHTDTAVVVESTCVEDVPTTVIIFCYVWVFCDVPNKNSGIMCT